MKAYQLERYGGPDALRLAEVPLPSCDRDQVKVAVRAIGINYPDLLITQGLYQLKPGLPFVPGCEIAGVIEEAGDGSEWRLGDRVAAFVWQGGYAEHVAVPANMLMPLRDEIDFATGAAMVVNYQTTHFALARRGQLRRGETLLVMGAAGGIGTAGVQIGKGLGGRVIGGVADEGQTDTARSAGADEVLILREGFSQALRELTGGRGVDVVLDPLGDWMFGEALRGLAPEGRILVVGFAAGKIPELRVNRLLLGNVAAVGVAFGAFLDLDPGLMRRAGEALCDLHVRGVVRPQIADRYGFEDIPKALHRLERGEIPGKAVAVLGDS
jgi:NADPH2:quinone reductase